MLLKQERDAVIRVYMNSHHWAQAHQPVGLIANVIAWPVAYFYMDKWL